MDYHNQNNVAIKIIRIFNTYGPNMNPVDGRVVSNFIASVRRERHYYFWRWFTKRSFQYVDDLVEGMIRMMNSDPAFLGPVNLGS
jgi:UDP-glucuronate decarboxylase